MRPNGEEWSPLMNIDAELLDWLLQGDPMIRFQVMRDLLHESEGVFRAEQDRIPDEGWGAQFLQHQAPDGSWPKGRWTETIWTLLLLLDGGMPPQLSRRHQSAHVLMA